MSNGTPFSLARSLAELKALPMCKSFSDSFLRGIYKVLNIFFAMQDVNWKTLFTQIIKHHFLTFTQDSCFRL
jgi:hypothetical protein